MNLYDSHTHLCSKEYDSDLEQILQEFFVNGGKRILSVSYDLDSAYRTISLKSNLPSSLKSIVDIGLGIHPEVYSIHSNLENTIADMDKMDSTVEMLGNLISSNRTSTSAIGETGLDYKWIKEDNDLSIETLEMLMQLQKISFKKHIDLSKEFNLPISIHVRDIENSSEAVVDALKILSQEGNGQVKGVFHSYTSDLEYLSTIIDLGFKVSINGIVTYKSGDNVREITRRLPEENLLLETDGPYLQPQQKRQNKATKIRYSVPSDIHEIAEKVAEVRGDTTERILSINERNYIELFN